jgi:hypothetical protein
MRKEKKLGWLMIPGCDGETLTDAYRLLARVYQLLNEYAPVWYSADLRDQLQAALSPPESETRRPRIRLHANGKGLRPKFPARIR